MMYQPPSWCFSPATAADTAHVGNPPGRFQLPYQQYNIDPEVVGQAPGGAQHSPTHGHAGALDAARWPSARGGTESLQRNQRDAALEAHLREARLAGTLEHRRGAARERERPRRVRVQMRPAHLEVDEARRVAPLRPRRNPVHRVVHPKPARSTRSA